MVKVARVCEITGRTRIVLVEVTEDYARIYILEHIEEYAFYVIVKD
jgi:hypothetical protein